MTHFDDITKIIKNVNLKINILGDYAANPFLPFSESVVITSDCHIILYDGVAYVYDDVKEYYIDPTDKTGRFKIVVEGTALSTPNLIMRDTRDHKIMWVVSLYKKDKDDAIKSLQNLLQNEHQDLSQEIMDMTVNLIAKLSTNNTP